MWKPWLLALLSVLQVSLSNTGFMLSPTAPPPIGIEEERTITIKKSIHVSNPRRKQLLEDQNLHVKEVHMTSCASRRRKLRCCSALYTHWHTRECFLVQLSGVTQKLYARFYIAVCLSTICTLLFIQWTLSSD